MMSSLPVVQFMNAVVAPPAAASTEHVVWPKEKMGKNRRRRGKKTRVPGLAAKKPLKLLTL